VRIPILDLKNNPLGVILKNSGEKIPIFFSVKIIQSGIHVGNISIYPIFLLW